MIKLYTVREITRNELANLIWDSDDAIKEYISKIKLRKAITKAQIKSFTRFYKETLELCGLESRDFENIILDKVYEIQEEIREVIFLKKGIPI